MGNRHNLERILVMNEDGTMNDNALQYKGMDRFECRKQIVKDLQEEGVLFKIEEHTHSVGHSERSGAVVEPYLSTQWFVQMQPLADAAIELQKAKAKSTSSLTVLKNVSALDGNIRDWCISRQLWWGHRIPAWYHKETGEIYVGVEAPEDAETGSRTKTFLIHGSVPLFGRFNDGLA
ncbi:class I tRNA ligase family protein [Bacillus licheniformis]|nr:class I tRNA ligase family protein [Bacillus licheniformis]